MRITIDLDNPSELLIIRTFYNLKYIAGNAWVRKSARRGIHLKVHGLPITFEESLELREQFGDDVVRMRLDKKRLKKSKQVLWTCKAGKEAGEWTTDVWRCLS